MNTDCYFFRQLDGKGYCLNFDAPVAFCPFDGEGVEKPSCKLFKPDNRPRLAKLKGGGK